MGFQKIVYRVLEGDTKQSICNKFRISAFCFDSQNHFNKLRVGMLVLIPSNVYVVCPGDSVSSIAKRFGIDEQIIKKINNLDVVFIGQKIKI